MSLLSVPKVSAGSIQKVIFSPEVIAIASATIIAPMIEPHINSFLARVPILSGHPKQETNFSLIILIVIVALIIGAVI